MVTITYFDREGGFVGYSMTNDQWTIVQHEAPGVGGDMTREQAEAFAAAQAAEATAEPEA